MKYYYPICDLRIIDEFCDAQCEYCEGYFHTSYSKIDLGGNMDMPSEWNKKRLINASVTEMLPLSPSIKKPVKSRLVALRKCLITL